MRFNNIQVLRLLAAITVFLTHLDYYSLHLFGATGLAVDPIWRGNWMSCGVPVFFAISGFVLSHALQKTSPARFLLARALRIYPGYWLAAIFAMGLMWWTVWPPSFAEYVRPGNIGWTLLPRGDSACIYPLGVEWSLVYEVVLYLWMAVVAGLFGVRRGLPIAAGIWALFLGIKALVAPGYGSVVLPTWSSFPFSAVNLSFLLGVLAYYLSGRGTRWRWPVLAGLVAYLAVVPARATSLEENWLAYAPAGAAMVWLLVQFRQLPDSNPLVRAGDYTYGLYLFHTPILMGCSYLLLERGWLVGTTAGIALVGIAALGAGLLYGRLESYVYTRLRPLARTELKEVAAWPGRFASRVGRPSFLSRRNDSRAG